MELNWCLGQITRSFWTAIFVAIWLQIEVGADEPRLQMEPPLTNGWSVVRGKAAPGNLYQLQSSSDLLTWKTVAQLLDAPFRYVDPAANSSPHLFYRLNLAQKTPADDWKSQITVPNDPFLSAQAGLPEGQIRWAKFAILTGDPVRVLYQDSSKYLFHYDFAAARLEPFKGMNRAQFDSVSLYLTNQQVVLGAVLLPPSSDTREYGIQFVGQDPYPLESVAQWFDVVRSTVVGPLDYQAFYLPVFEQRQAAEAGRSFLEQRGIVVSAPERWSTGNDCYASGWAVGRLKHFRADEVAAAYSDGRLGPGDILLIDGVPAELPFVSGIISLSPSTPNSHVSILARSYGVPFVWLADAIERERVLALANNEVAMRVVSHVGGCGVDVIDLGDQLDPAFKQELLALKALPPLEVPAKASLGKISASVDHLAPEDIKYFGGKAANFGFLRRAIPEDSPRAMAFSFDLWDAFLDQALSSGKTLRQEINDRLGKYSYPPDMAALRIDLDAIRTLIRQTATFSPEQQQAIVSALTDFGAFDANRKIRFRSSTNVEDSDRFTGAGLYDSYSGCLADDLDGDTAGPSLCDPDTGKERGVFRAIQRVYASFYNDNAFLERLRHGIEESKVGMALLVHHSFPDPEELANGVATLRLEGGMFRGELVTQAGAISVTNPDGSARPEIVEFSKFSFGTYLDQKAASDLVPLGGHVMEWEADYRALLDLLTKVAEAYQAVANRESLLLDFEYKKIVPGKLIVKQVREIPNPNARGEIIPFLLNEPVQFAVFQGEFGDVFGNHWLKSHWNLSTRNVRLGGTNLTESFYANARWEYLDGSSVKVIEGPLEHWPGAGHTHADQRAVDKWQLAIDGREIEFELITANIPATVSERQTPLLVLSDFDLMLKAVSTKPWPVLDGLGNAGSTNEFIVRLRPAMFSSPDDLRQERVFEGPGGVRIRTTFYWPKPPSFGAGYTAPLVRWVETEIIGLTSNPIRLQGSFSQTYRPEHHNFSEEFIFEPRLESGVNETALKELADQNIQLIHVHWGEKGSRISVLGFDGTFRRLDSEVPIDLKRAQN